MKAMKIALILTIITLIHAKDCGLGGIYCPQGTCHYPRYIEGCHIYASAKACYQCEFNYQKDGDVCSYSPPVDYSGCCRKYDPSGTCEECASGLALIQGKCEDIQIPGCIQKSLKGNCVNCALDYELFGGRCFKKIVGCKSYKGTGECENCDAGYKIQGGLCVPSGIPEEFCVPPFELSADGNCFIKGCQTIYDYGCAECADEFSLLPDGRCVQGRIKGCAAYNLRGNCETCLEPFYERINGFCRPYGCLDLDGFGECLRCDAKEGFYLSPEKYCLLKNCLISSRDKCLLCKEGYIENGRGCEVEKPKKVCTICGNGYFLGKDGECHEQEPGCIKYFNGKCEQCENHLYLDKNYHCQQKEPGCIYDHGVCASCVKPFSYKNYRCVIQGCKRYSGDGCEKCRSPYILTKNNICTYEHCFQVENKRCIRCQDGYRIGKNGFCHVEDPYCSSYNLRDECIKCLKGYYLNGYSKCEKQNFGCNYVDGKCVSCRAPFQFNSKKQICEIDGCLEYFLGGCKQCSAGYDLRYNTCKLPHCLVSHKGHCRECDPDYILRSDGLCVNKDQFCYKYNSQGYCVECAPKYFLSAITKKCKPRQPGCHYDNKDNCVSCDKPFYFDGVRCQIYGCLKLNFKGCQECFYPRKVTSSGLCQVEHCALMNKGKCQKCRQSYFLADDGSCKLEDVNCLVYGKSSCCQKCRKGYKVDKYGICEYADEHCWDFSKKGHCNNCDRLYYLNPFYQCELKDSSCLAYSGGICVDCKDYFYLHRGSCYPNSKGCLRQKNIKKCLECEQGYDLSHGKCTPSITKLSWNSIDMDFWDGESDEEVEELNNVFTVGKTSKLNLEPAIAKGYGNVIYSSCKEVREFQVDTYSHSGWEVSHSHASGQYIGVELDHLETFYALDVKVLKGNHLKRFAIEYSEDGYEFVRIGQYHLDFKVEGVVKTFYFKPVHASVIRVVVLKGTPNIKFEFYYSIKSTKVAKDTEETYIKETVNGVVDDSLHGQRFRPNQGCVDKELCWMGLELCEPKQILGFQLQANDDSEGKIESVYLEYSVDGVQFECYDECQEVYLEDNGSYGLDPIIIGSKFRIHPVKWVGEPSYSIKFSY